MLQRLISPCLLKTHRLCPRSGVTATLLLGNSGETPVSGGAQILLLWDLWWFVSLRLFPGGAALAGAKSHFHEFAQVTIDVQIGNALSEKVPSQVLGYHLLL